MVTFCRQKNKWVPWFRPFHRNKNGTKREVAAARLGLLKTQPPICPHFSNEFREEIDCTMRHQHRYDQGLKRFFFQVPSSKHQCPFIVEIPSSRIGPYVGSAEELALHDDLMLIDSEDEIETSLVSSSSIQAAETPTKSAQKIDKIDIPTTLTLIDELSTASSSPTTWREASASLTPQSSPASSNGAASISTPGSRFEDSVNALVEAASFRKEFIGGMHPAADSELPPSSLMRYLPGTNIKPWPNWGLYNNPEHVALRYWNSPTGITETCWNIIISSGVFCCQRVMSREGFRDHKHKGMCLSLHPEPIMVENHPLAQGRIPAELKPYIVDKDEFTVFSIGDYGSSPIA